MRAYKGFNRNEDGILSCQDLVYESGKTYKHEGKIKLCRSGFHACHELWQVWTYYPNNGKKVYYEVECGGDIIDSDDNTGKFVCSEIRLVKEMDVTDVARFNGAGNFCEGFAKVRLNGKWNYINTEGRLLSEQRFDYAWDFHEGFARVQLNGKQNYINTEGKLLSEQWFDRIWYFPECFEEVTLNEKQNYINSDGFAIVKLNGKYNFINTKGKLLSKQWFDKACIFYEGFAAVKLDGMWNFINTEGKLLSKQWFDCACGFHGGFAKVEIDGKLGKINTKGEFIKK